MSDDAGRHDRMPRASQDRDATIGSTWCSDPDVPSRSPPHGPPDEPARPSGAGSLNAVSAGVAHEFNNLLTIALGSLEQLRRHPLDERATGQLDRVDWAVRQAGRLSRQFLSVDRQTTCDLEYVDLNQVVEDFGRILAGNLPDSVRFQFEPARQPLPTRLDPEQLKLALLNLVRNATDAMPVGGPLVVRTASHRVEGLDAQPCVEVSVTDTGTGMSPEIVRRATESFFTTKGPGRGSGLGLWMVERFVSASGGKVSIDAAIGRGTTVRLVFPRRIRP